MNVRENASFDVTGDFELEITIPDGTDGALRVIADGSSASTSLFQAEIGVVGGAVMPRVRIDGVWTTL